MRTRGLRRRRRRPAHALRSFRRHCQSSSEVIEKAPDAVFAGTIHFARCGGCPRRLYVRAGPLRIGRTKARTGKRVAPGRFAVLRYGEHHRIRCLRSFEGAVVPSVSERQLRSFFIRGTERFAVLRYGEHRRIRCLRSFEVAVVTSVSERQQRSFFVRGGRRTGSSAREREKTNRQTHRRGNHSTVLRTRQGFVGEFFFLVYRTFRKRLLLRHVVCFAGQALLSSYVPTRAT